jgi:N-acetylglucosaminyl-diphospho-decaprenol L-rhamnosyltransferase
MDVSILCVTYNSEQTVRACLESALSQEGLELEVIVVDNASQDHTADELRSFAALWSSRVKLLLRSENLGFGKANNLAARQALGRHIFLLNPDARFGSSKDLARLVGGLAANPSWGLGCPAIADDGGAHFTHPAQSYPGQKYAGLNWSHLPGKIAWVLGAGMLIPRDLFETIGGFDERFFLYSEDTDLCLRIRLMGREIGQVPEALLYHIGGASEAGFTSYETTKKKQVGLYQFYQKHYPEAGWRRLVQRDFSIGLLRFGLHSLLALFGKARSRMKREIYRAIYEVAYSTLKRGAMNHGY